MRKQVKWKPEEASTVWWLVLWGLSNKETTELAKEFLTERSPTAINAQATEIRKFITEVEYKVTPEIPATNATRKIVRLASQIPPIKAIADLKPDDLTKIKFIYAKHFQQPKPKKSVSPNFEQRPDDYVVPVVARLSDPIKPIGIIDTTNLFTGEPKLHVATNTPVKLKDKNDFNKVFKQIGLEEVLEISKKHGARKVYWNGYTIKF